LTAVLRLTAAVAVDERFRVTFLGERRRKKHTSQFQKRYSETGEMVKEEGRSGA